MRIKVENDRRAFAVIRMTWRNLALFAGGLTLLSGAVVTTLFLTRKTQPFLEIADFENQRAALIYKIEHVKSAKLVGKDFWLIGIPDADARPLMDALNKANGKQLQVMLGGATLSVSKNLIQKSDRHPELHELQVSAKGMGDPDETVKYLGKREMAVEVLEFVKP